jgi:dethiobiotin synthetase
VRGLFVTGTDTSVGKTVVAAAICAALAARGEQVAAFKPVVTGTDDEPGDWPPDHELLAASANAGQTPADVTPITFKPPVSPHYAAELANATIDPTHLLAAAHAAATLAEATTPADPAAGTTPAQSAAAGEVPSSDSQADRDFPRRRVPRRPGGALICEGVGGLLVPLTPDYSVRDLAVELALPLIVVARTGLGTINHTLLTVEAARAAGLHVAGIVMTPWPAHPEPIEQSNRETVERLSGVQVSGLPPTTQPQLAAAGAALPLDTWLGPAPSERSMAL